VIAIEPTLTELRSKHLKGCLQFLDQQRLIQPSFNEQVGFDFQGLRQSYKNDPAHPDSKVLARFGRIWIYDIALSIYADLKAGRIRQAGYQVGRAMQLALQEEERGYRGLWHFSYNTREDSFIDPRGPTGCNAWCLNAIYAFILATGDTSTLRWANRTVKRYLFPQQVMDSQDPRHGLIRAGMYNPRDVVRGNDEMGYSAYEGDPNCQYEHVILEHNADVTGTFRLAFKTTQKFLPQEKSFLYELIHRHDLLMRGMRRAFWQGDHFVSAMDGDGKFYRGTDGLPSVAVDNNTWVAHIFLPYHHEVASAALRYVRERFLTRTPSAQVEDISQAETPPEGLSGVYYFPSTFSDPFVEVSPEDRPKMERALQPEATFGLILFVLDAAAEASDPQEQSSLQKWAQELYGHTVALQFLYGSTGAPYASARVPALYSTLSCVTTAATGAVVAAKMNGAPTGDFIGVTPPAEFIVAGQAPRLLQHASL